jgi:tetratricopeptide (TPR) repeat protein
VQLLRAMNEVFVPPQYGGNRERGLERWREAIQLFEQEASSGRVSIRNWGHAEAWAWLGGAYLSMSRPADARIALEEALKLRPDFWWATTALAQARRPLEK